MVDFRRRGIFLPGFALTASGWIASAQQSMNNRFRHPCLKLRISTSPTIRRRQTVAGELLICGANPLMDQVKRAGMNGYSVYVVERIRDGRKDLSGCLGPGQFQPVAASRSCDVLEAS